MSGFQAAIPPDHIEHLNHRAMIPLLQFIVAARIPDCGPGPAMDGRVQLRLTPERAARDAHSHTPSPPYVLRSLEVRPRPTY